MKLRSLKIFFLFFLRFFFEVFFWGGTSQIFISKQVWPYFFTEWMVYFSYMIWWSSFPEIYPISGFFPRIFIKYSDFFTEWMVYLSYMIWWFSFTEIYPVSGFFPDFVSGFCWIFIKSSDFFTEWMVYFSYMIWWFFFYGNLSDFWIFSPDFHQIFRFFHRIDGLLVIYDIYDMMIFFYGNLSGFRIFSGFCFRILLDFHQVFRFLHRMDGLFLIPVYDMMIFSGNLYSFRIIFRIFIKSSDFFTEWIVYFSNMIWYI